MTICVKITNTDERPEAVIAVACQHGDDPAVGTTTEELKGGESTEVNVISGVTISVTEVSGG